MNTTALTMALIMGLTGSLHCSGMCGPIVLVMPFQAMSGLRKWLSIGLYHFGRISVYAMLGLAFHSFKAVFNPQWQQTISVTLGIVLLLAGLLSFIPAGKLQLRLPWTDLVKKQFGRFIGSPKPMSLLIAGLLNGMLPCGLVYMALSPSITVQEPIQAAAMMYAFGLGTVPMLLLLTILKGKVTFLKRSYMRKVVPVFMFVFGSLFILRGMNLGVPWLSPKVNVAENTIKTSCCHKQ